MGLWLQLILLVLALPVLISMLVLITQAFLSLLPRRAVPTSTEPRPRCAVLIPAHNEQTGITPTIQSLLPQMQVGDRILVVADNCTDSTATTARSAGATVVERQHATERGKGYALDFGVRELEKDPPKFVIIVDADCLIQSGSIDALVRQAAATGCPIQGAYTMNAPEGGGPKADLSSFAFYFKNVSRPLGFARLGMPCLLTGSGMAFPWEMIQKAPLASGNLVEDMQLGIDLALAGKPPQFCANAQIISELPVGDTAAQKQGTRWIHGHLKTIRTQAPRLIFKGLTTFRPRLIGLALELSVLPQSLLFMFWFVLTAALALCLFLDGAEWWPVELMLGICAGVFLGLFAVWLVDGRERLPFKSLIQAPRFVAGRLPILKKFITKPEAQWERTQRKGDDLGR